jgi:F0F1-type ATP synthase assembly protein I
MAARLRKIPPHRQPNNREFNKKRVRLFRKAHPLFYWGNSHKTAFGYKIGLEREEKLAMIKNLLNADEQPPEGTKVIIEDSVVNPATVAQNNETSAVEENSPSAETRPAFEVPEDAKFFTKSSDTADEAVPIDEDSESIEALMSGIENLDEEGLDRLEKEIESLPSAEQIAEPQIAEQNGTENISAENVEEKPENIPEPTIFQSDYTPPSTGETIRNSGLAYSAAIVLFGSVIFMMILGWFADLLLGSSPWGIVGGIILGGIIGIIQLFRITSQIYKK